LKVFVFCVQFSKFMLRLRMESYEMKSKISVQVYSSVLSFQLEFGLICQRLRLPDRKILIASKIVVTEITPFGWFRSQLMRCASGGWADMDGI